MRRLYRKVQVLSARWLSKLWLESSCITIYCEMSPLLCTNPAPFSLWQGRRVFFKGYFQSHFSIWAQRERKKSCLSAQELNQFASMNHHAVSQNSPSNCSSSCPFVARISLAVQCLAHIAQLRRGKESIDKNLQDLDLVWQESDQDWINRSLLLADTT